MDMIERVARAIDAATWASFDDYAKLKGWDEAERREELLRSRSVQKSFSNAEAAIEAMRYPTGEMVKQGMFKPFPGESPRLQEDEAVETWQAMIDAALAHSSSVTPL